jgi:hypothetical protein
MTALEEFLQQKYVENFESFDDDTSKIIWLQKLYPEYFYIPANEGIGALRYVVDSEGHALYLIKKSGLPDEIKSQLMGGEAGNGTYSDYQTLNDVYGVTSNLKVYYSSGSNEELIGISSDNLDNDNPLRVVFDKNTNSKWYSILSEYDIKDSDGNADGKLTAEELKMIVELTLDEKSGINDLQELYNLTSLKRLYLNNLNFDNLNGLQNATNITYIALYNCNIADYTLISARASNLQYLYFQKTTNDEITKFVEKNKSTNFLKLEYFGVFDSKDKVTNLDCLANLTSNTKERIKYLYLYNNKLSDITFLSGYKNLSELQIYINLISTLDGLNSTELITLSAYSNLLGKDEIYDTSKENLGKNEDTDSLASLAKCSKLSYLALNANQIKWVSYIENCVLIKELYLKANDDIVIEDVKTLKGIWNNIVTTKKSINSEYLKFFSTEEVMDFKDCGLTNTSEEILNLYNNTDVKVLRLDGNTSLNQEGYEGSSLNEILKTCINIEVLSLEDLTNLTSADFLEFMPNLKYLDLWNCSNIDDLSVLEENNKKLKNLFINNSSIDLTKFQNIIEGLNSYDTRGWYGDMYSGLVASSDVMGNIANCKNLENIHLSFRKDFADYKFYDLSNCSNLKTIVIKYCRATFKFPKNLTSIDYRMYPGEINSSSFTEKLDFSLCENLTTLQFNLRINIDDVFGLDTLKSCRKLECLKFGNATNFNFDFDWVSELELLDTIEFTPDKSNKYTLTLLNCDNMLESLKILKISNFLKISGLTNIGNIEELELEKNNIENINFINNSIYLKKLVINDNLVTSLAPIKDCINLSELNLSNNLLYNQATDSSGNSYDNLKIISDLHNLNSLTIVKLSGNSYIADWSKVASIVGWDDDSKSGWYNEN